MLGNPVRLIDPRGDTVKVATGNVNINYEQGMQYQGNSNFAASVINSASTCPSFYSTLLGIDFFLPTTLITTIIDHLYLYLVLARCQVF